MANTPSYAQQVEMQYDSLIKIALGNEKKNYIRDMARLSAKQSLFCELGDSQTENFEDEQAINAFDLIGSEYQVLQNPVVIKDAHLCSALSLISERARNIVFLSIWLNMTDKEIADETGEKRSTVNDIRNNAYKKLREIMERDGYESSNLFVGRRL